MLPKKDLNSREVLKDVRPVTSFLCTLRFHTTKRKVFDEFKGSEFLRYKKYKIRHLINTANFNMVYTGFKVQSPISSIRFKQHDLYQK